MEKYTVILSQAELQFIESVLVKRPFEEVAGLVANISAQVNKQIADRQAETDKQTAK